jgi:hypothetical protein
MGIYIRVLKIKLYPSSVESAALPLSLPNQKSIPLRVLCVLCVFLFLIRAVL